NGAEPRGYDRCCSPVYGALACRPVLEHGAALPRPLLFWANREKARQVSPRRRIDPSQGPHRPARGDAMTSPSLCPGREALERLVFGRTSELEAAALEGHVESCSACLEVVRDLQGTDPLIETVRHGVRADAVPVGGIEQGLIPVLCRLPQLAGV